MEKYLKKILFALVGILMVGALSGCTSDKTVKTYLQALLDASYKNDSSAFVDMKLGKAEEAQALYIQGIDTGVSVFCSRMGISDEYKEEFRQLYMEMLGKVRYTVDTAEKQSDGSYIVSVTYEKMRIFEPALTLYQEKVAALGDAWKNSDDVLSEEEIVERVILEFKESMEKVLSEVTYEEAASMNVKIELEDNVYTPNAEDIMELEKALFDGE
ncbi:MAG: hypothetical protein OSJ73_15130 [Lachnospiraceae bacterium]|jgi:hypothetical protein|nr:hypothetical protein [Lachnospiraceae bacterium]